MPLRFRDKGVDINLRRVHQFARHRVNELLPVLKRPIIVRLQRRLQIQHLVVQLSERRFLRGVHFLAELLHAFQAYPLALDPHFVAFNVAGVQSAHKVIHLIHDGLNILQLFVRQLVVREGACQCLSQFLAQFCGLVLRRAHADFQQGNNARVGRVVGQVFVAVLFRVAVAKQKAHEGHFLRRRRGNAGLDICNHILAVLLEFFLVVVRQRGTGNHFAGQPFRQRNGGIVIVLLQGIKLFAELFQIAQQTGLFVPDAFQRFVDRVHIQRHFAEVVFQRYLVQLRKVPNQRSDSDNRRQNRRAVRPQNTEHLHADTGGNQCRASRRQGRCRASDCRKDRRIRFVQRVDESAQDIVCALHRVAENFTDFPAELFPFALEQLFRTHQAANLDPGDFCRVSFAVRNLFKQAVVILRRRLQ